MSKNLRRAFVKFRPIAQTIAAVVRSHLINTNAALLP